MIAYLAYKIGVTIVTIKRILKELQNKNIIKREGNNSTGKWKIM